MNLARKKVVLASAGLAMIVAAGAVLVRRGGNTSDGPPTATATSHTTASAPLETGVACYYARKFQGAMTASGERLDVDALTAAHRTLPFGTRVRVTNLDNGKFVVVRIIDRGPHNKGRVIDLSPAAAEALDMLRAGVANVELRPIDEGA